MKKVITIMILAVTLMLVLGFTGPIQKNTTNRKDIKVVINGDMVKFDNQQPVLDGNRVLIPIRNVSEQLGFKVEWSLREQKIKLLRNDYGLIVEINLQLNSKKVLIKKQNEKSKATSYINIELDVPAKAINGRTLIPIRAISEIIGLDVKWDSKLNTVTIDEKEKIVNHYIKGKKNILDDKVISKTILDSFQNSFDAYRLMVLEEQFKGFYKSASFLELDFKEEKTIQMENFPNQKVRKIIVVLEDSDNFSEGMIMTEDSSGAIKVWAISQEQYENIIKK